MILAAKEELLLLTVEFKVSTRPASDEDSVVCVPWTDVMLLAREELLFVIFVCSPSILVAAELLFVVTVLLKEETLALKD